METNCRKLVSACVQLGVQPSAVECLFSKDSEIKKVEFNDSPENRKEVATSKLFTRQHPNANEFSISIVNIFTFLGYLIKQWGNKMVQ